MQRTGLLLGLALFLAVLILPPPAAMPPAAWRTAAVAVLMASWWITEALPIAATALLPLVLFPFLGVAPIAKAAPPYANSVVFLVLGGFILAAGLERSGLHRRIALNVVRAVGTRPANLVGGFMIATALISMWVSNTATVLMMLPIATSVMAVMHGSEKEAKLAPPLLIGIAYAASIGGVGTLIGTPPNALLAGFASETLGRRIGFVEWMAVGVPLVVVAIPICWLLLTRVVFHPGNEADPETDRLLAGQRAALGSMSRPEWITAAVCSATALAWVFEPLLSRVIPSASDAGIAIAGGLLLFLIPVDWKAYRFVIGWNDVERLPWGVLILFGGGLSLAVAVESSGLAAWIGTGFSGLSNVSPLLLTAIITTAIVFFGEIASNTATAATFLPLVASLATGLGIDPLLLAIPTALAASCSFMLPAGTPPNALVYADGRLTIAQMARAGIWMDLVMIALIVAATFLIVVPIFGK
ncbi:MAG TPA: DASS family sodium-coupled anion symporter [Thermoanaerobaculia bacterium]|nr:DASS family sodium-coupled anion symporter [Thermoanaerobaculia bacterium]